MRIARIFALLAACGLFAGCGSAQESSKTAASVKAAKAKKAGKGKQQNAAEKAKSDELPLADGAFVSHRPAGVFAQRRTGRRAPALQPISFEVDKLPVGGVPTPLDPKNMPASIPESTKTPEGVEVKALPVYNYGYGYVSPYKPYSVRPKDFLSAEIRIGNWSGQSWAEEGYVQVYCGVEKTQYGDRNYYGYSRSTVAAHWEGPRKGSDGALLYTFVDGWFDTGTCKFEIKREKSVALQEIVPGLLYGFRSCPSTKDDPSPKDCNDANQLTLVFPRSVAVATTRAEPGPARPNVFSRVTLPLRRGTGESMTAEIADYDMRKWISSLTAKKLGAFPAWRAGRTYVLGVEVQEASFDQAPVAVAFVGKTDTEGASLPDDLFPQLVGTRK